MVQRSTSRKYWLILINAQYLLYKLDELRAMIFLTKPLFVCVTETWLTPDMSNDIVNINGYKGFRNDRMSDGTDKRRGGGTIIYASLSINATSVYFPSDIAKPPGIECTFVKFFDHCNSNSAYILCVYLPPDLKAEVISSFSVYITDCFDFILMDNPEADLYVCGDVNRHNLSFLTGDYNLQNVVNFPTFGNVTLDKLFCPSNLFKRFDASAAPGLGTALHTHSTVVISRNMQPHYVNGDIGFHRVYDLRTSFVKSFCDRLASSDWTFFDNSSDVEHCTRLFYDRINEALSVIPVSFIKFTPRTKPWITPVVIDLINKRWKAYRDQNFHLFCHFKVKVKAEIAKAKEVWSKKMCNSSKGIWSVVNNFRGKNSEGSVNHIVSLFHNRFEAVETINACFSELFVKSEKFSLLPVRKNVSRICDETLVFNLLRKMKTDKACGSDDILPVLLKKSAETLCNPLCTLINLSFEKSVVPQIWKAADICPVPKSIPVQKDKLRPISLLPIMSKICENVILSKYGKHLIHSYDDCQFAYRPRSSTVCALISIHEKILCFADDVNIRATRVVTFDMTRAFDCVPHHLLLSCVSKLNLPDGNNLVNWLNSYLQDRTQRVRLGVTKSSFTSVSSGVPQGSVIGPVLFAVYLSTYKPLYQTVHLVKYADDVSLVVPVFKNETDDIFRVNDEIKHFEFWCNEHNMSINFTKSKIMNINFGRNPVTRISSLENVSVVKILGLFVNDKLTWSDHFNYIVKKLSQRLYVLRILKPVMSHNNLVLVFNAIILSVIDYACPVFLNCGTRLNDKLVKICKRAFRIIHGYDVKNCPNCNMLDIEDRRKKLSLKLFRTALFSDDHMLHDIMPPLSYRSNRLVLPCVRTARRINSFVCSCALMHNSTLSVKA